MKNPEWLSPLMPLAWVFFKIGFLFFGGGYVLIPLLHHELVVNLQWLNDQQFVDGTAISQLTPGPVAVLATFAGYMKAGIPGALVATAAMFLPGSLLMIFLSRGYEALKGLEAVRRVLNTLIPVIAGLLVGAALQIGENALTNWVHVVMLVVSLVALIRFNVNPALLIIVSALMGLSGLA